jgi:hypothetical protein
MERKEGGIKKEPRGREEFQLEASTEEEEVCKSEEEEEEEGGGEKKAPARRIKLSRSKSYIYACVDIVHGGNEAS